jgi:hypothetical protein
VRQPDILPALLAAKMAALPGMVGFSTTNENALGFVSLSPRRRGPSELTRLLILSFQMDPRVYVSLRPRMMGNGYTVPSPSYPVQQRGRL